MTVALIMDRGDKVKNVLLDSLKMKHNDDNIVDRIEDAYVGESLKPEGGSSSSPETKYNDEKGSEPDIK